MIEKIEQRTIYDVMNFPPNPPGSWVSRTRIQRVCPKCNRIMWHWGMRDEPDLQKITVECCSVGCHHQWQTEYIKQEWRD